MKIALACCLLILAVLFLPSETAQAQPQMHYWMLQYLNYPNGTPVPAAQLGVMAWLSKVSGYPVPEVLTEASSDVFIIDDVPKLSIQCSAFGEWDNSSTWWADGDTIYVKLFAYNDPQTGLTDSALIYDILFNPMPDSSWQYYDESAVWVPVELASFSADKVGEDVVLTWITVNEIDNLGFYVQRSNSLNGAFARINELITGRGFSNQMAEYSWTDVRPEGTVFYYKLEDVDFSGRSALHGPVRVIIGGTTSWGALKAEFTE